MKKTVFSTFSHLDAIDRHLSKVEALHTVLLNYAAHPMDDVASEVVTELLLSILPEIEGMRLANNCLLARLCTD